MLLDPPPAVAAGLGHEVSPEIPPPASVVVWTPTLIWKPFADTVFGSGT